MSNYLAIATVTATLQRMLQAAIQVDVPGAQVTMARPDATGSATPEVGVNIYLYQVAPNPAWRNADLRNRRPKGDLIKQAQAGLDLYYLMTFYGNEADLEPQRLLGSTVRTLVDYPILTGDLIRETINHPMYEYLQTSTLADQIERVTMVPSFLSTEDLSKIWSVLFQTPYTLSFAYQGGAVLIEGTRPSGRGLPIRSRQFYTTPNQPTIERIITEDGSNQPITLSSPLTIVGKQLRGDRTRVSIGEAKVTPQSLKETVMRLQLSDLTAAEVATLRPGVQQLQVLHLLTNRRPPDLGHAIGSNVLPFVLCPTIVGEIELSNLQDEDYEGFFGEITLVLDLNVGIEQRVFLFLNERVFADQLLPPTPAAYIFAARSRPAVTTTISFAIAGVQAGTYLVRVQVDGAESLLNYDADPDSDTFEQYIDPIVIIG